MSINHTGTRRGLAFYLILTLIVVASVYFPDMAFISYFLIIASVYVFNNGGSMFRWGTSWKFGFIFGFTLISIVFLLELGLGWIKLEELYPGTLYILTAAVVFELLASVGEELSFRGYILPHLKNSLGTGNAIIATSVLFAGLHIPSIYALDIGSFNAIIMLITVSIAGILLALLYLADGLKMSCGFHFSWNLFQYHVFSLRSGFGIFGLTAAKPLYTGGQAGPEAGIIGFLILLVGVSALWALFPIPVLPNSPTSE